ncbi:hypothetical protein Tco_0067124, partial [Tanacetum coccineum]
LRRSGRFRGQRPMVEKNTIDKAINAREEDFDDDFVPVSYPSKQLTGSIGERISNRSRGKKPVVEENTIDAAIDVDEEASDSDFEAVRVRGSNGETADVFIRDTCADTEAGPSKVRKQKKKGKNSNNASTTLRTRSSPKALYLILIALNPSQQACVAKLGFSSLLDFKVDGIPSRLGFYVVGKFDPKAMEIKLKNGSLMVNKEVISEMLGLRNEEKDITPSIIKSKIRRSNVVDFNFKLNIIMLFANILGCCKKTGSCELEILNHINRDTNLCNINWCQYVWDSLPNCKDGWRKELLNNFFCGPVTLLTMIYVDGVQFKSLQMVRKRPPMSAWSAEILKEIENEEIASGGFGLGDKEFPFLEEDENGYPKDLEGYLQL